MHSLRDTIHDRYTAYTFTICYREHQRHVNNGAGRRLQWRQRRRQRRRRHQRRNSEEKIIIQQPKNPNQRLFSTEIRNYSVPIRFCFYLYKHVQLIANVFTLRVISLIALIFNEKRNIYLIEMNGRC